MFHRCSTSPAEPSEPMATASPPSLSASRDVTLPPRESPSILIKSEAQEDDKMAGNSNFKGDDFGGKFKLPNEGPHLNSEAASDNKLVIDEGSAENHDLMKSESTEERGECGEQRAPLPQSNKLESPFAEEQKAEKGEGGGSFSITNSPFSYGTRESLVQLKKFCALFLLPPSSIHLS